MATTDTLTGCGIAKPTAARAGNAAHNAIVALASVAMVAERERDAACGEVDRLRVKLAAITSERDDERRNALHVHGEAVKMIADIEANSADVERLTAEGTALTEDVRALPRELTASRAAGAREEREILIASLRAEIDGCVTPGTEYERALCLAIGVVEAGAMYPPAAAGKGAMDELFRWRTAFDGASPEEARASGRAAVRAETEACAKAAQSAQMNIRGDWQREACLTFNRGVRAAAEAVERRLGKGEVW